MKTTRHVLPRLLAVAFGILVLLVGGFVLWGSTPLGPTEAALTALNSDEAVEVMDGPWLTFRPTKADTVTGLILYPGGRVDPRSYAPLARAIAARGHLVIVIPMPLNLAVLAPDRADGVMAAYPSVATWAVGGHSLGGAMAARYADRHEDVLDGLVLWAAYPASSNDLSNHDLAALSIYATQDGLMTVQERTDSEALLPANTCWVVIDGGNHAQFGDYGAQRGDNPASISKSEQHAEVVDATASFLRQLGGSESPEALICSQIGGAP
ncbi:MAG: alpha/beta hydrolase [Anaerolineae bacterium]